MSIDSADEQKFILDHNCYWQTTGNLLIQLGKGAENWDEAMNAWLTTGGTLTDWSGRRTYLPSEFSRYQAECGQDQHSLVAKPLFVDEPSGDYRQRADSPCQGMGMQTDVRKSRIPKEFSP